MVSESPTEGRASSDDQAGVVPVVSETATEIAAVTDPLACPKCGGPKAAASRRCATCARRSPISDVGLLAQSYREVVRATFRVYCVMCGRSSEVVSVSRRPGRCGTCGGTQLTENT